ncbi:hypothetical protein P3342_011668 [Pyrenophora teres f. teres]|uniref:Epidermal growth factor receptor-like transmembrane-juxtamembrane segment domain-containing protein n=2 Tax=Pyrenophora teres f. teres TaxID=97479 RepID=E3RS19_PYRTT|nr:hypothetical protein PTT_11671 [Pyrenophora teres f. teres 0-1]KAK1911066.1 hypothetical protein P3342_011668 [Pyrenophora teres f. teres]CAE7205426.1 DUF1191 multi-domain protein [Pyrenophora teres f. teres]
MANSSFFDFHCEAGVEWHACASGSKFVGCCAADPCSNGCAQGSIRPGAFNITHHGEFPDASCGAASNFWSCIAGPSFWGCCKSNPCSTGICPQGDLVPAFMDRPEQLQAYVSASSTDASTPSTPGASASPKADTSSKSNTGAIVGGVVGGVFVIGIIGALILFFLRRRRNRKREEGYMGAATMVPMMNAEKHNGNSNSVQYDGQSPPPTYSSPEQNYQQGFPVKGQQSYHQFASHASEPQELPADVTPPRAQRYSELPAEISQGVDNRRFSELPAGANEPTRPSELESPETSPRPQQTEFPNDMAKRTGENGGLGIH